MKKDEVTFYPYLDFYWKFIAMCILILVFRILMNVSMRDVPPEEAYLANITKDPLILLLGSLILFSIVAGSLNFYRGINISFGADYLKLKSRWKDRTYKAKEIEYIKKSKKNLFYFNQEIPHIKIKIKDKSQHITINPARYKEEKLLLKELQRIGKML